MYLWSGGLDLECNGLGIAVANSERSLDILGEGTYKSFQYQKSTGIELRSVRLKPRELLGWRLTDIFRGRGEKER